MHAAEQTLADSFRQVARGHADEADIVHMCHQLAQHCNAHVEALAPLVERYGEQREDEPERLHAEGLSQTRSGGVGLLRDLQDLYMLASLVDITWTLVGQAGQGARDQDVIDVAQKCQKETIRQLGWLRTRLKAAAPQALLVAK